MRPASTIEPHALAARLARRDPVVVLDVRRAEAWCKDGARIPGAVWIPHDKIERRADDLPRDRDVVVYCSCPGEATSARVARWLRDHGFSRVFVLAGGLRGWRDAALATEPFVLDHGHRCGCDGGTGPAAACGAALPTLAERHLRGTARPTRVVLATLFVDIAGSTRLLAHHAPETVLARVQRFMRFVTEVALAYCGDVKDFEGDGVLLYFDSASEAMEAARAIRAGLASGGTCETACPIEARMSVTVGEVVLGTVGTSLRHTVALVGPTVSVGARLLKHVRPGGVIATGEVIEALQEEMPALAQQFHLSDPAFEVPGTDGLKVATWILDPTRRDGCTDGNS